MAEETNSSETKAKQRWVPLEANPDVYISLFLSIVCALYILTNNCLSIGLEQGKKRTTRVHMYIYVATK